jgi:hypothetical protein
MRVVSPFPDSGWPALFAWIKHEIQARVLDDYAPIDIDSFVELMRQSGYRSWAVERDGEIGGFVSFQSTNARAGTCWFIFRPRFLSDAPAALSAVLQDLFAGECRRVVFLPFVDNGWAVRILKDLGAVLEGTLRGSTLRAGVPANQFVMALLSSEVKYHAGILGPIGDCGSKRARELSGQPQTEGGRNAGSGVQHDAQQQCVEHAQPTPCPA